jgi:hypothetical protein
MKFAGSKIAARVSVALCVSGVIAVSSTDAAASSRSVKLSTPEVLEITSRSTTSGRVDVVVKITPQTNLRSFRKISVEVESGTSKCVVRNASTSCLMKNVKVGQRLKIRLRAKSGKSLSNWSKPVTYKVRAGKVWKSPRLRPFPPKTDLARARVLSSVFTKVSVVQSISRRSTIKTASVNSDSPSGSDVVFTTTGVIAYARADSANSGSGLLAVMGDGTTTDALLSGAATIENFYLAPTGDLYVVFQNMIALTQGGQPCLLAKVNMLSGIPSCVDSSLSQIMWARGGSTVKKTPPVQFDNAGSVYYAGYSFVNNSTVLRRVSSTGAVTDIINDNISLRDFLVLTDGTVLLSGSTNSSGSQWLRRLSPSGAVKNLVLASSGPLWVFADGNVYAGVFSGTMSGVKRYLTSQDVLENKFWISSNTVPEGAYYTLNGSSQNVPECAPQADTPVVPNQGFCVSSGAAMSSVFNISGSTYVVAGQGILEGKLFKYFPTVEKVNIQSVVDIKLAEQAGTNIVLAGTNTSGVNTVAVFNTLTNQETVVMDGSNEIEVYSMSYNSSRNTVVFSGLRFSDNTFVVGEVLLT